MLGQSATVAEFGIMEDDGILSRSVLRETWQALSKSPFPPAWLLFFGSLSCLVIGKGGEEAGGVDHSSSPITLVGGECFSLELSYDNCP